MVFLFFMLLSVIETSAMYYLMFKLFKFDIYVSSIVFASIIASFISFSLREMYGYFTLDILLQLVLTFLFLWLMFRVHVFYAAVMAATGFIAYLLIQTGLYFFMNVLGFIHNEPGPNQATTYLLQLISAIIACLIGKLIHLRNKGFSFVPHSNHGSIALRGKNRHILLLYVPAVIPITLIYYFVQAHMNKLFFIIPVSLGFALLALLSWANRRELSDD